MKFLINMYSNGIEVVNQFREFLKERYNATDSVVVNLVEPGIRYYENNKWNSFVDLIEENVDKNIFYYGCNYINKLKDLPHGFYNNMFHCGQDLYVTNEMCKGLLKKCINVNTKNKENKKWDLLLGGWSDTKDMLSKMIKSHEVIDEIFFTYYRKDTKSGHWGESVPVPKKHTAETIEDKSKSMLRYSDLIDPEIYNQTFYTAYTETIDDIEFGVFTEKTAKPIVAKRPFVVFGSPGHLQALKSLGFKTFSSVIDESYDMETNREKRFRMVIEAMGKVNKLDPVKVYEKLNMVLNYNKDYFEKNNWNNKFRQEIKECDEEIHLTNFKD
jgi:hypothetical protein